MREVLKGLIFLFLLQGITADLVSALAKELSEPVNDKCVTYCFDDVLTLANHISQMNIPKDTSDKTTEKINKLDKELQICKVKLIDQVSEGSVKQKLAAQKSLLDAKEEQVKDLRAQIKKHSGAHIALQGAFNDLKAQISKFLETRTSLPSHYHQQEENLPANGLYVEGIRRLQVAGHKPFEVPYISPISSWTIIQRRIDGWVNFDRNWHDYRRGFGNAKDNFWVGLDNLYLLLKTKPHELYIQLADINGKTGYARYDNFTIAGEWKHYKLESVGKYSGTAGDSLSSHVGALFSTHDRHNNIKVNRNCALDAKGGWWYTTCGESKLNGWYYDNGIAHKNGITWGSWAGPNDLLIQQSLTFVQMMIRPTKL